MRMPSEEMSRYIEKLCNPISHAQSIGKPFNIYTAAAITHCIVELHSLNPSIISDHLSSLVKTLLDTLEHLVSKKDYESIPPLVYQLFGLTKTLSTDDCVKVLRGIASLLETLHRHHLAESAKNAGTGKDDIAHWTISTSLSHLGTTVRNNPALSPVLLDLIKGKYSSTSDIIAGERHGLRYETITPILLAMGITLSSAVPRMKRAVFDAIRDLILEEEMVRAKRFSSKWLNGNMALLAKGNAFLDSSGTLKDVVSAENIWNDIYEHQKETFAVDVTERSLVMKCIKDLVILADSGKDQARGGGGAFSALYPTLESIGFLLIDSIKKDIDTHEDGYQGAYGSLSVPSCATQANRNSTVVAQRKAKLNAAQIGRSLLVFLFIRAGMEDDSNLSDGLSGNSAASHPLCRSIIQNSCSNFIGMTLNAIEHSRLLLDLVNYDSKEKSITSARSYGAGAHMIENSFLPMIIDLLANIQGGSISPLVVVKCIIPTLRILLSLCAELSVRSRRKRNEFNDHIDHLFLLSKKVLFCTDIDRRKVAVNLLVLLIDISKIHPDKSMRDSLVDEVTGYLKRCMSQHQSQVRSEAYTALVSILERNSVNIAEPTSSSPSNDQILTHKESVAETEVIINHLLCSHVERYIAIDEDASILEARRKRAIQHGTHLSQVDLDDDVDENAQLSKCPLRLDLCTAVLRASVSEGHQLKDNLTKKGKNSNDTLTTAVDSISEPFPFLLMALIASLRCDDEFDSDSPEHSSVFQVLLTLQIRMAESSLDSYLMNIDGDDQESMDSISEPNAIKMLAICLLVASTSEVLMSLPSAPSNYNWEIINRLFILRTSAVFKAAAVLASVKTYSTTKKKKSSKKKNGDEIEVKDKKNEGIHVIESSSERSRDALEKYRVIIEDTISKISPSPMISFIEQSLEKIGVVSQPNGAEDPLHIVQDGEQMEEEFARSLLTRNVLFRRFLLYKSANVLGGASSIITSGLRAPRSVDTYGTIAFRLSPLLLCEFFSHIRISKLTSLLEQTDTPLSLVALQGFLSSAQRIRFTNEPNKLSELIDASWKKVLLQFPESKLLWEEIGKDMVNEAMIPSDEKYLYRSMYPFFAPQRNGRGGIVGELIHHGLDEEAALCCDLIKVCLLDASPTTRKQSVLALDQSLVEYEGEHEQYNGILHLDYDVRLSCQKSAVAVLDSLILFDDLLDGTTIELILPNQLKTEWRSKSLISTITLADFSNLGIEMSTSLLPDTMKNGHIIGSIIPICNSFAVVTPIRHPFDSDLYENQSITFNCVSAVSSTDASTDQVSKEQVLAASSILHAIDDGLVDTEFVATKISPHLNGGSLMLIQKMMTRRLIAASNVICACAPVAISLDNDGNFVAGLLKACKRIYSVYCKIIMNYTKTMSDIMSIEHSQFSRLLGKLKEVTIKLLSTIQEKTKVGNSSKALTESKIDSHGRIASYLVFEFEKCESLLLKLSGKLKSSKLLEESKFIQDQINITSLYDFRIGDIDGARERAKRKNRKSGAKSQPKKRKVKEEMIDTEAFDVSDDDASVEDTASVADSVAESNDGNSSEGGINLSLNIDESESDSDDSTS